MSIDMILQIRSTDSADTECTAEMLGGLLNGGEVINLVADLGGGKTTFCKGLAKGIGSKDRVASPTFTICRVYRGVKLEIHHYDFYRLSEAGMLMDQIEESMSSPHVITVIEWADIIIDAVPPRAIKIELKSVANNPDKRNITISYSEISSELISLFETKHLRLCP